MYVRHFLKPQFLYLGRGGAYFKPKYIKVFGDNVTIEDYPTLIGFVPSRVLPKFVRENGL